VGGSKEELGKSYLLIEGQSSTADKSVVRRWFEYDLALKLLNDDPEIENQKIDYDDSVKRKYGDSKSLNGEDEASERTVDDPKKTPFKTVGDDVEDSGDDEDASPFSGGGVYLM
jgi:hypothetical protein